MGNTTNAANAAAADTRARPGSVDAHHHFYPKFLMDAWADAPISANEWTDYKTLFMKPPYLGWTPERTVALLDEAGITTAVLSLPTGTLSHFTPDKLPKAARDCNEFAAEMARDFPGRFGLFAVLPMPDIDASLDEIAHGFEALNTTGIGVMTSYGNRWLGHPDFEPVLAALNERHAVVHVHPRAPPAVTNLVQSNPWAAAALLEFPFDTARTIFDLIQSGSMVKFRNIQWIFSHCGGVLPMLAGRLRDVGRSFLKNFETIAPDGLDHEFRRLHYDTAVSAYSPNMKATLDYIPVSQIVFGTDYPHISVQATVSNFLSLELGDAIDAVVLRDNPRRLLSRLPPYRP